MSNKLVKQILHEIKTDRNRLAEEELNSVQIQRIENKIAKNLAALRTLNTTTK